MSIFYEIIGTNGQKSYLFGTLHLGDNEIITLPEEVKAAFVNARICIFEANVEITNETMIALNNIIKTWLQSAKEQGMTEEEELLFKNTTPILFSNAMLTDLDDTNTSNKNNNIVLDKRLMVQARKNNKELFYLETVEKQTTLVFGYNIPYKDHLQYYNFAKQHIANGGNKLAGISTLKKLYLAQDIQEIARHASPSITEDQPEVVTNYFRNLIRDRDSTLADDMESHLEEGNAFVAIGASHLQGVIKYLLSKGYSVNPISLSNRVHSIDSMILPEEEDAKNKASNILTIYDLCQVLNNTSSKYHDLVLMHENAKKLLTNTYNLADVLVRLFPLYANSKKPLNLLSQLFYQFKSDEFNPHHLLNILSTLEKTNLLTQEHCQKLLENAKYSEPVSIILNRLSDLLTDQCVTLILREADHSKLLASTVLTLQKSGLLTEVHFNKFLDKAQHINSVSRMLIMTHSLGILTDSNFKIILEMTPFEDDLILKKLDAPIDAKKQVEWIGTLLLDKKYDELSLIDQLFDTNSETGPLLRTHKNTPIFLWEVLFLMHKRNILNKEYLDDLLYYERNTSYGCAFSIVDIINLLDKAHLVKLPVLLDRNVFSKLLVDCCSTDKRYIKVLTILFNANILNERNFNALMQAKGTYLIHLKKLQKANLVTDTNFQILLSGSLDGKPVTSEKIVNHLIKHNITQEQGNDTDFLNRNMIFNHARTDHHSLEKECVEMDMAVALVKY